MNKTSTKNRARVITPLVLIVLIVLVVLFFVLRPGAPSATSPEELQERTFDVAIQEGAMVPGEISVDEGDLVNLQISSDSPIEFHVHGYDVFAEAEPGAPGELSFEASITGRFEIENHDSDPHQVLGVLLVQPR